MDILSVLKNESSAMSKGQRRIADYILDYYDKAAFMTANRLGKAVDVSESTVVRFAVQLGYDGYPAMQKALQKVVRNKLTSVQRIEVVNDMLASQDVASMVLCADMDTLQSTNEALDRSAFEGAVDAISKARHVYIAGARSSSILAGFMNYYLRNMLDSVKMVESTAMSEMFEQLVHIGAEDVIICISFPRYSSGTIKAVNYCKQAGATVISLTDSHQAPAANGADHVLVAKSEMVSIVDSLVAPMSIINAILVAVGRRKEAELASTYAKLERIWEENEVYERYDT
ncbi:MAG: MurR/RpiR family transcriptional regulator [Eubacteriales bacterium]